MLNSEIVLITGAAGRIGESLARAVVESGGFVILVDINKSKLDLISDELGESHVLKIVSDATNTSEIDFCIAKSMQRFGRIDAAVHSAYPRSRGWGASFENLEANFLFEDLNRHLGGAILFSQRIFQYYKKQGYGNLIHISSVQGISPPKFEHYEGTSMVSPIEYSAIKAGLIALTRYLAKYSRGSNIRVNCISPGGILDDQPAEFLKRYKADCVSKGMLDSGDVIGALLFLISQYSKYVTGQNIVIDDGWSL